MRKAISITNKDMDIVPHLEKQSNMSQYIISLVRKDMVQRKDITEDRIIELIKRYAGHIKTTTKSNEDNFPMDSIMGIIGK